MESTGNYDKKPKEIIEKITNVWDDDDDERDMPLTENDRKKRERAK